MFGLELLSVASRLLAVPGTALISWGWYIDDTSRLDLLPTNCLNLKVVGGRFFDFLAPEGCHFSIVMLVFFLRIALTFLKYCMALGGSTDPIKGLFSFSWGGIDAIGDFCLHAPFFTPLLVGARAFPGFLEPFSPLDPPLKRGAEMPPRLSEPIDFRKRIRWVWFWVSAKLILLLIFMEAWFPVLRFSPDYLKAGLEHLARYRW